MPIKVPLQQVNFELGESFHLAYTRFLNLEKRLHMDPTLFYQYKNFIDQYVELNHGEYCDINSYDMSKDPVYFLPHHAVIKQNAVTTKLRAVFDGSMQTNKKISLNDILLNGPVVQKDLFDILIAFRLESYFFICDIKKMFRCIDLDPSYRPLQNILWSESPEQDIRCIQLKTVIYGLKSSSYLATRCLIELAARYKDQFPLASSILENNTYVDDILANSCSEEQLLRMQTELIQLLSLGGFELHKWASNCNSVLKNVNKNCQNLNELDLQKHEIYVKTLGITFDIEKDVFKSTCPDSYISRNDSKRDILSYISKFYDPLGLIGPIFVHAKVIMQKLWATNTGWDSTPPDDIRHTWVNFTKSLTQMEPLSITRCVKLSNSITTQLIGFADASSVAYGCCLYLRSIDAQDNVLVQLLCSKSRINPLRKKLTIPRLELNAALLLAKLCKKVLNTLSNKININKTYLFSDSQIALAWLRTDDAKLQTYVANRVRAIRELSENCHWQYVNTEDNPSDCLSRGLQPHELKEHNLWWHGPPFLQNKSHTFQSSAVLAVPTQLSDLKTDNTILCAAATTTDSSIFERLKKFSSINKMTRVLAYVIRFCKNIKPQANKQQGFLKAFELNRSLMMIVKHEQEQYFSTEIKSLKSQKELTGNLKALTPFLDANGLMRIEGCRYNSTNGFLAYASSPCMPPVSEELAPDLTTDTFLACFKRFIARRNLPSDVHCDNGSTFKGARNQLDELYRLQNSQSHQYQVQSFASVRAFLHTMPSPRRRRADAAQLHCRYESREARHRVAAAPPPRAFPSLLVCLIHSITGRVVHVRELVN
ncbi:uncharacterized protein LOC123662768 [Melitaea cinxia]|uniref:uncharacterized protein LOC123662768 n=1 Tax=Melitaea cinxia TaxID=113334 RepID=UPI001E270352|nr:uncharacterized protein LOC123662768 [Melitaea cinxia]